MWSDSSGSVVLSCDTSGTEIISGGKGAGAKPDALSSIPGLHIAEVEN